MYIKQKLSVCVTSGYQTTLAKGKYYTVVLQVLANVDSIHVGDEAP